MRCQKRIYEAVYQRCGGELGGIPDAPIWEQMELMSEWELFDAFLQWEGIIGYTDTILGMVSDLKLGGVR